MITDIDPSKAPKRWGAVVAYGAQALATASIVVLSADLYRGPFGFHFPLVGDAQHHLMVAQALSEGPWLWDVGRLSAPYALNLATFPVGGTLDQFLLKFLVFLLPSAPAAVEMWWLLLAVITAATCMWSVRKLGYRPSIAFVAGIAYAILPHIYYRNIAHIMLSYHLVPIVTVGALALACRSYDRLSRRDWALIVTACFLVGFNYVYTAFFACASIAAATIIGMSRLADARHLVRGLALIGTVLAAWAVCMAPTIIVWAMDSEARTHLTSFKTAGESDLYGMKLRHLVHPIEGGIVDDLTNLSARAEDAKYPLENENRFAKLGTSCSIGFFFLLFVSIARPRLRGANGLGIAAVAALNFFMLLLATIGGLGSLFNLLLSPEIRCYNRASVFIAFYSLIATCAIVSRAQTILTRGLGRLACVVPGLWLAIVIADQRPPRSYISDAVAQEADIAAQRDFVAEIEGKLPSGSMIAQLPFSSYPVTRRIEGMLPHDHLRCYWLSHKLRWTYPALSGQAVAWNERLAADSTANQIDKLVSAEFSGIWIDRYGYRDRGKAKLSELEAITGVGTIVSDSGRYAFLDLRGVRAARRPYAVGQEVTFGHGGSEFQYLLDGWADPAPGFRWTEGNLASLSLDIGELSVDVLLRISAFPLVAGSLRSQHVEVVANGVTIATLVLEREGKHMIRLPAAAIKGTDRLKLDFVLKNACSPESLGINSDRRILAVAFRSLTLETATNESLPD